MKSRSRQQNIDYTLKDLMFYAKEFDDQFNIECFTCYDCPRWQKCPSAFDIYNTDGDCIEEK
jgi:hypothetical protein